MSEPIIKVLVEVKGTSISGESTGLILEGLNKIATAINGSERIPKVKFQLDVVKTRNQIQSQLNEIAKDISLSVQPGTGTKNNSKGGGTNAERKALAEYNRLLTQQYSFKKRLAAIGNDPAHKNEAAQLNANITNYENLMQAQLNAITNTELLTDASTRLARAEDGLAVATSKAADSTVEKYTNALVKVGELEAKIQTAQASPNRTRELEGLNAQLAAAQATKDALYAELSAAGRSNEVRDANIAAAGRIAVANGKAADSVDKLTEAQLREAEASIQALNAMDRYRVSGVTFGNGIMNIAASFKYLLSYTMLFRRAISTIKEMVNNVVSIDTQMIELKKVTDETDATYSKFMDDAAEKAKTLHTEITDVISATAGFARLGYSISESSKLAEAAIIYSNVGDEIGSIEDATKSVISTMTAFNIETSNIMSIVDMFNEVGNNFAISSGGIGEALQRSASSFAAANNTLAQSIALITAANTVVQNPEMVGTAYKTATMRIRSATTELEAAGEEVDEYAKSASKLREGLLNLTGVDVMLDENTFKSTYDILDEISQKWGELEDVDRANVLEIMFGKRQGNVGSAVLSNFDIAREALDAAEGAAGSAEEEFAKWTDSITAKLQRLSAAWQSFSQSFVDSELIKGVVDFGTNVLGVLESITKYLGSIPTLAAVLGGVMGAKNSGIFALGNKSRGGIFGSGIGFNVLTKGDYAALDGINAMKAELLSLEVSSDAARIKTDELNAAFIRLSPAAQRASTQLDGTAASMQRLKTAGTGFTKLLKGFATGLLNMGLMFAAGAAISFVVGLIDNIINRTKHLEEATEKAADEYLESSEKLKSLNDELETNRARIEELNKVKASGEGWTQTLQNERAELVLTNRELENQLTTLREIAAERNKEARDTLRKEVGKKTETSYTLDPVYKDVAEIPESQLIEMGKAIIDAGGRTEDEPYPSIQEIIQKGREYYASDDNIKPGAHNYDVGTYLQKALEYVTALGNSSNSPTASQEETLDNISASISKMYGELEGSMETAKDIGDQQMVDTLNALFAEFAAVYDGIAELHLISNSAPEEIRSQIESLLGENPDFASALESWRNGYSIDFLDGSHDTSYEYALIAEAADKAGISMAGFITYLKEYGYFQGGANVQTQEAIKGIDAASIAISNLTDNADLIKKTVNQINALATEDFDEILKAFPQLTDEIEKYAKGQIDATELQKEFNEALADLKADEAAKAFDELVSAYESYGEGSSQVEEALEEIEDYIPDITDALYDENGALRDGAAVALASRDSLEQFLNTVIQTQLAQAQANYENLRSQIRDVGTEAVLSAQKLVLFWQTMQGNFSNYLNERPKESSSSSSGGSGSKSIYSKEYEAAAELADHYIELSELTQKRMKEGGDAWMSEQQKQYAYTQEKANLIKKELDRLSAKGYSETNEEFAKLRREYENAQNDLYDVAESAWEAQRDSQIDALESQKDRIEELKDAEEDRWKEREKQLDYEISKQEALISALETYQELRKSFREEQLELDGQIAIARQNAALYDGTNVADDLFSDAEYKELTSKLVAISKEAEALYEDVLLQINEVTQDNVEELDLITSAFERQYDLKLKEYEVAKQELAVARARKELENVQNERNVAMLVNGVWTWVADPEAVRSAIEAVNEAEADSVEAITELADAQRQALLEDALDGLEKQKILEEALHEKIMEGYEAQLEAIESQIELLEEMEFVFEEFIKTFLEGMEGIASAIAGAIASIAASGSKSSSSSNETAKVETNIRGGGAGAPNVAIPRTRVEVLRYASGGVADYTGIAHLDGTKSNPEVVFNSTDAAKLYDLIHNTPNLIQSIFSGVSMPDISPQAIAKQYNAQTLGGANNSKTVYVGEIKLSGQDSSDIISIMERVVPSFG